MPGSSRLPEPVELIKAFVEARNLTEKIEYARRHPELLSDNSLRLFEVLKEQFREAGEADFAETLSQHRALLERARDVGLAQASEDFRFLKMWETVGEFIAGRSWMDSYVYLQRHPELTSPKAFDVLVVMQEKARREGNAEQEKIVNWHAYLLKRVKEIGAEPAFIEVGGADFLRSRPPGER